jgi:putative DNA primase/helicase
VSAAIDYRAIGAGRVRSPEETAESRAAVRAYWHRCDYAKGSIAARYLTSRGLPWLALNPAIRFRLNCWHWWTGTTLPAMVALVLDARENVAALHRTFLTSEGRKADVKPVKASKGSFAGGAIRLGPLAEHMCIGEGIESSASAGVLLGLPAWSAIACGNLGDRLVLPLEVRCVTIACDYDADGIRAAKAAAKRWRAEGRTVRIATPDKPHSDFNDLLMERSH